MNASRKSLKLHHNVMYYAQSEMAFTDPYFRLFQVEYERPTLIPGSTNAKCDPGKERFPNRHTAGRSRYQRMSYGVFSTVYGVG